MHVLVIYATIEGQTRKIARNIAGTVQSAGHDVTVYDAMDLEDVDLDLGDAVIVTAPVHAGSYPAPLLHWVSENKSKLSALPSVFVSVSLSAASPFPEEMREVERITAEALEHAEWKPHAVHQAAGALRFTKYDYLKRLLMRHIAKKEGKKADTSKDHEFTDWDELNAFVLAFLKERTQKS